MPAPDFHNYPDKVRAAERDADPGATEAQRDAGNAAVGTVHMHGYRISVTHPKGSTRTGRSADGKTWSRTLKHSYGYVCGTEASDGDYLDVWIGDHPASQLVFLVSFLTATGDHDEDKVVLGCRNYAEAKALIGSEYPEGFWDARIGEVRGMFAPELKRVLKSKGILKTRKRAVDLFRLAALAPTS